MTTPFHEWRRGYMAQTTGNVDTAATRSHDPGVGSYDDTAQGYVPPYPRRLPHAPTVGDLIRLGRKSLIAVWPAHAFALPWLKINVLRRQVFVCNNPETVKEAFATKHEIYQRKTAQMRHALEPLIGDGLFVSDGETWKTRRRIVAPIIHTTRVPNFFPVMVETIEERTAAWRALGEGAAIDALQEMAHLTAEIICRTIFGRQLGRHYASEVVESFTDYQQHIDQVDMPSLLGMPDWFPRRRGRRIKRAVARIDAVLDEIISSYAARSDEAETSVIGGLLDARDDDGRPLARQAIRNEASVIFMAGHETTANTLAWAWFLLSQVPSARARLHHEVDAVLADRTPEFSDIARLPYTRAVIEETLRLYPPVPVLGREALRADTLAGQAIPRGSIVLVVPWLLHRNPTLWERADHFEPERFLGAARGGQSKYGYVPFAIGPRICAGLTFGLVEAILALAMLARRFDPALEDGVVVEPVCRLSLRPGETLPMRLTTRNT